MTLTEGGGHYWRAQSLVELSGLFVALTRKDCPRIFSEYISKMYVIIMMRMNKFCDMRVTARISCILHSYAVQCRRLMRSPTKSTLMSEAYGVVFVEYIEKTVESSQVL